MAKTAITREEIENAICRYVEDAPGNRFPFYDAPIWETPLVGFSSGSDPLYSFFKGDIGDFYQTPEDVFRDAFPDTMVDGERLTVISWVLPQSAYTKSCHAREREMPSHPWVYCRMYGEEINKALCMHMIDEFKRYGIRATNPYLCSERWQRLISEKYGESGTWSERHTAYVSGLGTFSLTDGLITEAGMAVRVGSLIAEIHLEPTPRPYKTHTAYCLFYEEDAKVRCTACIDRCPVGAIDENGHDKLKCKAYGREVCKPFSVENYGLEIHSCGLCQVGVPCESRNPTRK